MGSAQPFTNTPVIQKIDNRTIAAMRFFWALAALIIIYIDPTEPNRYVEITYAALILYLIFGASLFFLRLSENRFLRWVNNWSHWIDVCWFTILIGLSSGTNSIFFFGFFFSIMVASFRWGFRSGLVLTITSVCIVIIIGFVATPTGHDFQMARVFIRPINLFVLGYLMAYRGGREMALKGRLKLLKEVTTLSNPRFGIDHTIGSAIEGLRSFYNADSCLLIVRDSTTAKYRLHRSQICKQEGIKPAESIDPELAGLMLSIPTSWSVTYGRRRMQPWSDSQFTTCNNGIGERLKAIPRSLESVAATLDAGAFVTVPLLYHKDSVGRLYVITKRKRHFDDSDIEFLQQVIEQIAPVIDNIRLVDRLASDAAEQERQKIARDIHDGVIQPYIGLQIGLVGLRHKLNTSGVDIENAIDRLIELTDAGVKDLREYVYGLKESGEKESSLAPAIRRYAAKFAETTGIAVDVNVAPEILINDRLAAEVFHMTVEGLSNVRRHTDSIWAGIRLDCTEGRLELEIENDGNGSSRNRTFMPYSLSQRTAALGGEIRVGVREQGGSAINIQIPL